MVVSLKLLRNLGNSGLQERLSPEILNEGVANAREIIEAVRTKTYERDPHLLDDFCPDTELYNALGAIYPQLSREDRKLALCAYLAQMDSVNTRYVNTSHTPFIREPLVLANISIERGIYWPGLNDQKRLWENKSFDEFREDTMDSNGLFKTEVVQSDFLVAYAILRGDCTNFGEEFRRAAHPQFLDRVYKGIAAIVFAHADNRSKLIERRRKMKGLLPTESFNAVDRHRIKKDWILLLGNGGTN
jgi:hypothetical protein